MDWRICNHLTSFVLLKKLFVIHDLVLLCWLQMTKTVEDNSCWSIILWAFCMWMSFVFELLLFHVRNLEWVFFFENGNHGSWINFGDGFAGLLKNDWAFQSYTCSQRGAWNFWSILSISLSRARTQMIRSCNLRVWSN